MNATGMTVTLLYGARTYATEPVTLVYSANEPGPPAPPNRAARRAAASRARHAAARTRRRS